MSIPENELKTPVFDWDTGDFLVDARDQVVCVTGSAAAQQIAVKALQTIRGVFLIYADIEDEDLDHKYGNDTENVLKEDLTEETRLSEIERAIEESLIYDPWITEVREIVLKRKNGPGTYGQDADHLEADEVEASLTINTIFDEDIDLQGVIFNNG